MIPKIEIAATETRGTAVRPTQHFIPIVGFKMVSRESSFHFSCMAERASLMGTCTSLDDLRDVLRAMLSELDNSE